MTWTYHQSSGRLLHNGELIGLGYSGRNEGKNNPQLQHLPFVGPLPRGRYRIGTPIHSEQTGAYVLELTPVDHDACGRDDFQIHGDNANQDASSGCIILALEIRRRIVASHDRMLIVET